MASKSSFLPRLSLSRTDNSSVLPLHNSNTRYPPLRSKHSEYDLDDLSPRAEDALISSEFHDPNSQTTMSYSNRKPTGILNRRPSNSSAGSKHTKIRKERSDGVMFAGPPPPIAMSRVFYRDGEEQYDDNATNDGAASWLPGTARKAFESVMWDRNTINPSQKCDESPVVYDRNSIWRGLQRRERAIVADLQTLLQIQEESLSGGRTVEDEYSSGSATPTGTSSSMAASTSRLRTSIIEPLTRSGPGGEIIPVRQPRQKKLGISGARKGITRSMEQLANLKAEEEASLLSALSTRKQGLAKLRKLATRRDDIAEQLSTLEMDGEEPLAKELEDLGSEHNGVSDEIRELEERLAGLKTRRRYLEGRMEDVKNRRDAGLSGYRNALREVEETSKVFLTRPPVKPLDVEALAESTNEELSPGGVEFMRLRPERRTFDMAREWWESEVAILEKRKAQVDTERAALEEGSEIWEEVISLVLDFEADLRRQMSTSMAQTTKGKGKERELTTIETVKLQYEKINAVVMGLEQRLRIAEDRGWNLLIAAIGAELEAFREAARMNRDMLKKAGVAVDVPRDVLREDSGATGSTNNSFHTVNGGSMNLKDLQEHLLDLPNNREDDKAAESSDNEVPDDLMATHEGEREHHKDVQRVDRANGDGTTEVPALDRETSDNEVPPEFLVEHHDDRG
ncbi:hypothetical protein VP1G_03192 [Cytospora mali]|uniref:Autophagy-related protein 28 n=1 Tax=Cytospora mali TaxID=578113 RepID=A0A194UVQ5_CYTMA|nr:hypothetical protein VP1G_03192 [Valsa mali var. pyri (nom. inval.)]